ncbi:hypothetical protein RRG08_064773 [Elysia crispata]|uniref:C-type lectin domain-containing protein n=1 Tax=Elysia crispata TaxID=231223 RepID=A0AAE0YZI0_9GAST|nr:hypothetical protein RRG08_064773 [Elysia crispata]
MFKLGMCAGLHTDITVFCSSVDLYCTAITLLVFGKGVMAANYVQHTLSGQSFTTFCDGQLVGLNSAVRRVEIFKNGTQIYQADPNGQSTQDASVNSWNISTDWPKQTDFKVKIFIESVEKRDEGRLSCQVSTSAQGTLKKLITYLFVHDHEFDNLCPKNWDLYPPLHVCFNLFNNILTWLEATHHCREIYHAHLVVIPDQAFDRFLTSYLHGKPGTVWIGLTDSAKEQTFVWSTQKNAIFTNWASSPISSTATNCVEKDRLGSGAWRDVSCNKTLPFICERLASSYPRTSFKFNVILLSVAVLIVAMTILCVTTFICPRVNSKKNILAAEAAEVDKLTVADDDSGATASEIGQDEDEDEDEDEEEDEDEDEEDY